MSERDSCNKFIRNPHQNQMNNNLCMYEKPIHTFFVLCGRAVVDLQLPMKSVHITTNVLSSNSAHSDVYSIQHYVIKFVGDLWQGVWFSPGTPVSSTNKIDHDYITKILLKVALNTITVLWGFRNGTKRLQYPKSIPTFILCP